MRRSFSIALALLCMGSLCSEEKALEREGRFRELAQKYHHAEVLMEQGECTEAMGQLKELIGLGSEMGYDRRTFLELSLRLAEAEMGAGELDRAQERFEELLQMSPPDDLYLKIHLQMSRLLQEEGDLEGVYLSLREVAGKIPQEEWPMEERSYFQQVAQELNEKWQETLLRAERLFDAALFEESVPLYTEVVRGINKGVYPDATVDHPKAPEVVGKVRHRLAEAYYLSENYDGVRTVLSNLNPRFYQKGAQLQELYLQDLFLLGSACRHLGDLPLAKKSLEAYFAYESSHVLKGRQEALFEWGMAHYEGGESKRAQELFSQLAQEEQSSRFTGLAQLYLGKLAMESGDSQRAQSHLEALLPKLAATDPLRYEVAFLLGEAWVAQGELAKGISHFRQAIPGKNQEHAHWVPQTLYKLGWAYLEMGDGSSQEKAQQGEFYTLAEETFHRLLAIESEERGHLALARTYLHHGLREEAEEILQESFHFHSDQAQMEALALHAEASEDFERRELLYRELTSEQYASSEGYGKGWYSWGVNAFEEAQKLRGLNQFAEAKELYSRAIERFYQAFERLKDKERGLAGTAMKCQAKAYLHQGGYESTYMALSLLESLMVHHPGVYTAMRDQDEVLYYRGLAASHLMPYGEAEQLGEIAEASLGEVVEHWPQGSWVADALNVLGRVQFQKKEYDKAEQTFVTLASQYPYSDLVGEAWFWAGEAAEGMGRDQGVVRKYRRKVFEEHPHSPHGAEAYFTYYSYGDYLQGQGSAMEHLKGMSESYPNSPYLIVANYLMGLDLKGERFSHKGTLVHHADVPAALVAFEQSRQQFDFCYEHGLLESSLLEYFTNVRYRSMLERSHGLMEVAKGAQGAKRRIYLEYGEQAFREVLHDFEPGSSPLVAFLEEEDPSQGVQDEAEFGLAQVLLEEGNGQEAQAHLDGIIRRQEAKGVEQGLFLSQAWYHKGRLAMEREAFGEALICLSEAERCGRAHVLTSDQLLDLWIQEADCFARLGSVEKAMDVLAKVIHMDTPSPQRVRAMYQRALLYEEQGRRDLALQQFEATSRKGGEWALRAQDHLESDYRYY